MKNKRYKRIAKRVKGTCSNTSWCDSCKYIKLCIFQTQPTIIEPPPSLISIRHLEQIYKGVTK